MWRFTNIVLDVVEWIIKHLIIGLPWIILGLGLSVWILSQINGVWVRIKKEPIFKEGHLIEYQETISYDLNSPSIFMYILEVVESETHRQGYIVHLSDSQATLVFDQSMGIPRWYLLKSRLKYILPIASYDLDGKKTQNPRIYTW